MCVGDFMNNLILNYWCRQDGVLRIFYIVKTALNVIRLVVPIGLIIMIIIDLIGNVLKPDDKDSSKKILNRLLAAVIVFFIPTVINFVMTLIDKGANNNTGSSHNYNISECWTNAR